MEVEKMQVIIEDFISSRKMAVIKDKKLVKFCIEEKNQKDRTKNIYLGIVKKVVKSINSCFVDIGEDKEAYLKLENDLKEGDKILVQVQKEEKGDKRMKLSEEISLSGRYLVLLPTREELKFSGKIRSKEDKKRIEEMVEKVSPEHGGYIVRTDAMTADLSDIEEDVQKLRRIADLIEDRFESLDKPTLLYDSKGEIMDYIDRYMEDIDQIVYPRELDGFIDRKKHYKKLKVEEGIDIFEVYGVNNMLKKYRNSTIWLREGVSIVIDCAAEAMSVIDVNTGRFKGSGGYEDTVYRANKIAAEEIASQIMIRNISGIILVDFIDMKEEKHRKDIKKIMSKALLAEGRRARVYDFTRLGLLEIARRRENNSLASFYDSESYILDRIEQRAIYVKNHTDKNEVNVDLDPENYRDISLRLDEVDRMAKKYSVEISLNEVETNRVF